MAKSNKQFICQSCGSFYSKWTGKCEQCNEWNTLLEETNNKPSGPLSKSFGQKINFEYSLYLIELLINCVILKKHYT